MKFRPQLSKFPYRLVLPIGRQEICRKAAFSRGRKKAAWRGKFPCGGGVRRQILMPANLILAEVYKFGVGV